MTEELMRFLRRLGISLPGVVLASALAALPARSQNLLVNPGFDRGLSGWTARTVSGSSTSPTADTFVTWVSADAAGSPASGGAGLHAKAVDRPGATAAVGQCVPVLAPSLLLFGARFLVNDQRLSGITATVRFFASADCSGASLAGVSAPPLPSGFVPGTSGGAWLPVRMSALVPAEAHSVLFEASARADWTWAFGIGSADVVADDAFLTVAPAQTTRSLLPSAAWINGVGGAYWRTALTLVNPGAEDAAATLKWLGHDADGRGGSERSYLVPAGRTLVLSDEEWELNHSQNYGAILVTASSPSVFLQSETSTHVPGGGTVGQALHAFGPADFAAATPKSLAPIRENAAFRTNLVLANPTEVAVIAHVALHAADGTLLGERDVPLPPLGMTQLASVASVLGGSPLGAGRIAVSTPTPGGAVAAYASVIDNGTNDPRTLLPKDGASDGQGPPTSPNLLVNPGFDRDLSSWTSHRYATGATPSDGTLVAWSSSDVSNSGSSGSAGLHAQRSALNSDGASVSQCVSLGADNVVRFGAKFLIRTQKQSALTATARVYATADCSGPMLGDFFAGFSPPNFGTSSDSGGTWVALDSLVLTPPGTGSVTLDLIAWAQATREYGPGWADVSVDDAYLTSTPASASSHVLPSAAWTAGASGAYWRSHLTLVNPGSSDSAVFLRWLSHDVDGRAGFRVDYAVHAGESVGVPDYVFAPGGFGALQMTSSSSAVFLQSETSTAVPGGRTVGQALSAFGPAEFATATPKAIAPIRENAAFRTNLVLSNPMEIPVTARVILYAADGALLGQRDVDLPPLGMTQIASVASVLGASPLDAGRLSVSTPTPGGAVAAYASVIDNVTNDPRTLLPR